MEDIVTHKLDLLMAAMSWDRSCWMLAIRSISTLMGIPALDILENIDCSYSGRCQSFCPDSLLGSCRKALLQFSFGQQIQTLEENVDSIHFRLCQQFDPNLVSDDCEKVHLNKNEDFSLEHHGKCRLQLLFPMSTLRSRLSPWSMQKTMNSVLVWTTDSGNWGKRW